MPRVGYRLIDRPPGGVPTKKLSVAAVPFLFLDVERTGVDLRRG